MQTIYADYLGRLRVWNNAHYVYDPTPLIELLISPFTQTILVAYMLIVKMILFAKLSRENAPF